MGATVTPPSMFKYFRVLVSTSACISRLSPVLAEVKHAVKQVKQYIWFGAFETSDA